jgi:hypothetical protein
MNIEQAKQIPLQLLVEHLGGRFSHHTNRGEAWFFSPFRPDESTPSFKIDEAKNTWHDFGHVSFGHTGQGSGGDILNLWCDYYGQDRKDVKDALSSLSRFSGKGVISASKQASTAANIQAEEEFEGSSDRYQFTKPPGKIFFNSLKTELQHRGISLATAAPYLQQGYILDSETGKKYNGFAFRNDKGGYEISIPNPSRNSSFKTSIGIKSPTSFSLPGADSVIVFEGVFDFLTWMEMNKGINPQSHMYILNSVSFIGRFANQVIQKQGAVQTVIDMLDNDKPGEEARVKLCNLIIEANLDYQTRNKLYDGYDDLNQWWEKCPTARQDWAKLKASLEQKVYHDTVWTMVNNATSTGRKSDIL